ncbi:MAG: lysophospholipid acyltransferase family protein [Candidatus Accumulibacter sp.]|jgi:KDO2-lipid IV(A) lauroyltransferase|nr:lysophospholipid acyltransferase family protein [Accumulibacter sp.]
MLRKLLSQSAVALFWLLHFLPPPALAAIGGVFGRALFVLGRKRREVARINLELCFPELAAADREKLARDHFRVLGRSILERSALWWSRRERLERMIRIEGAEKLRARLDAGQPVILLAPHFVGLDAGGVAVAMRFDSLSMYAEQANPVFDRLLLEGRRRFGDQMLLTRQDGIRAAVKAMKSGRPFYYLPDLNTRRREAVFVPFFGVPAATTAGLSRLARVAGAAVLTCVTRALPGGRGYLTEIGDAWEDFPTADATADTARMNAWIEAAVRAMPEQYYWVHRRFKTRPVGEAKLY